MALSDPIADMLTRVRNASRARHVMVDIPMSGMKTEIARILREEGYINGYKSIEDNKQGILRIYLKNHASGQTGIVSIDRISKPGRREYRKAKDVGSVCNGMGTAIMSTSRGIMTDKKAKRKNLGGEIICNVW